LTDFQNSFTADTAVIL